MDLDEREQLLKRDGLLLGIAVASLLNGMPFSPLLFPVVVLLQPFVAGTFIASPMVLTYLASFLAAAMTLVLAGIPAAIYERLNGLKDSTPASLGIWLVAALILVALPRMSLG
jgi:hypothetical protein